MKKEKEREVLTMLSQQLKQLREAKGMTQLELSRDLDIAPSTVGMYETGRREPDYNNLKKIARYFKVSPNDLIGWYEPQDVYTPPVDKNLQMYERLPAADRAAVNRMIAALFAQAHS